MAARAAKAPRLGCGAQALVPYTGAFHRMPEGSLHAPIPHPYKGSEPGARYAERSLPLHVLCLFILPERYKFRMAKVIFPGPLHKLKLPHQHRLKPLPIRWFCLNPPDMAPFLAALDRRTAVLVLRAAKT